MLQKLTHEEWWTDTSIVTDENGAAALDVFKGDYVISLLFFNESLGYGGAECVLTNIIENIDKAFFRRISYVFHFQKPNFDDRKKIWKNLFKSVPLDDEVDFDFISKFDISGGNIKNIVVSSCFKGAQENNKVSMKHILKSIEYELKKQGYTPLKSEFGEYSYLL